MKKMNSHTNRRNFHPNLYYIPKFSINYTQDPLEAVHISAVYTAFTFPEIDNGEHGNKKYVSPPYANTHKSLAINPYRTPTGTTVTHLSTWQIINTLIIYTVIYHYLSAETGNTSVASTIKDAKVQHHILYVTRYHMASKTWKPLLVMVRLNSSAEDQYQSDW